MTNDQLWEPYKYLESIPGKYVRVKHVDAFNAALQAPQSVTDKVKWVVQRLHTTSLLIDDIEDDAVLRRGQLVAHRIYGAPRTINSANFVMLNTLQEACSIFPDAHSILFEELLTLHRGQGLDLFWRDTHICPSEEEYIEMVQCKTGGLYRLAVKLLQLNSPLDLDLSELANCLSLIYQIQDDYLNLIDEKYEQNKGFAEDITEGKYSFPVVKCVQSGHPQAVELQNILKLRSHDNTIKRRALRILETSRSLQYTVETINKLVDQANELIAEAPLDDPSSLYALVKEMVRIPSK